MTKQVPKDIKTLQEASVALMSRVVRIKDNIYRVPSRSKTDTMYIVTIQRRDTKVIHVDCSCKWSKNGGIGCIHQLAALRCYAGEYGRDVSFWVSEYEARHQKHKVYQIGHDCNLWMTIRYGFNTNTTESNDNAELVAYVDGNYVNSIDECWTINYSTGKQDADGNAIMRQDIVIFPMDVLQWSHDHPDYKLIVTAIVE